MRTVFVSEDAQQVAAVREKLAALPAPPFRKGPQPEPEDWCLLGSASAVADEIARYRDALAMTHLVAVRPRIPGMDSTWLTDSFAALARLSLDVQKR